MSRHMLLVIPTPSSPCNLSHYCNWTVDIVGFPRAVTYIAFFLTLKPSKADHYLLLSTMIRYILIQKLVKIILRQDSLHTT